MRTKVVMFRPGSSTPVMNTLYAAQTAFVTPLTRNVSKPTKVKKQQQ